MVKKLTLFAVMEACAGGATSGSVSSSAKGALASWMAASGSAYFDAATCQKINSWCASSAAATFSIDFAAQMAVEGALMDTALSAAKSQATSTVQAPVLSL